MIYEGIDFAHIQANLGRCYVSDDSQALQVLLTGPNKPEDIQRRAIDCPLGVSWGLTQLVQGHLPPDLGGDGYKTRETERWLRNHATMYQTNQLWRARSNAEREQYPRASYFNGGSHVQSAAGLQIVPACLAWLLQQIAPDAKPNQRLAAASAARRGEGLIIEAHPRMFLYSAIERLYRSDSTVVTNETLNVVAGYKGNNLEAAGNRRIIYDLLQSNPAWMGQTPRELLPVIPPEEVIESDHTFDAWLAALTAWAHEKNETLGWIEAGIDPAHVGAEGHILVLR
ncbi:DUF429 domain-containing protein [Gimesia sp.]|uniref:DUF429 domain-containing protein n=1 Tax=Gimesia sp. TaxID=2024833 RepID=UPI0032F03F76